MSGRLARASAGLLVFVFISGLGVLAALVPVGHGFAPKGGGWFRPAVVGGAFTLHPLLFAVPSAACFVLGLLDWRRPWRVEQLDLLALAGFFPVAMLLSDDVSAAGLWLAAVCLGWLFCRMLGVVFGAWQMPELRPSISARWLGARDAGVRIGSLARSNISDVGQAARSSPGALHDCTCTGRCPGGPGGLRVYRPDSYGPFAYYAYIPFVAVFPTAPAVVATLLPALCFDTLTLAGLHKLGRRLGGRPLAQAFVFAYLLYPFPDLSLMAETNDALIAALCVWTIVLAAERPVARGLLMAAAVLTKFLPALLALQFLGVRRGRLRYALTLVASLAAMLAWPLISSGPAQFLDSTFSYQLIQRGGGIQFSIWTYMPQVAIAVRAILAIALVLLALSPMWRPEVRDVRECAALAAALLIGAQLLLGYWFYSYLTWCYPLLVIAIIQRPRTVSIRRRYTAARNLERMRVLVVEDEPYMAEAIRDGLRLEAIAADIAGDGDTALELLGINAYDIAVLDRDIPGPSGDEIAESIVASGSGMPILMLTAADRLDDKASGFGLGADDYLTKPFELRELVLRLRALDRRRAHSRPPVREIAGLRLDPFRREVYRDGRYVALTRKQFAVLEVLVAAEGGVISAEELLERAWDENADPFTNAVRITVSALRKRLGEPWDHRDRGRRRVPHRLSAWYRARGGDG